MSLTDKHLRLPFNDFIAILPIEMKYASIFITIVLIWVAIILMAITRRDPTSIFELYISGIISTLALFLIGFSKR